MEDEVRKKRRRKKRDKREAIVLPDATIILALFGLMVVGAVMVYSTTSYTSNLDAQSNFLKKQILAEVIGIVGIGFIYLMPYQFIRWLGSQKIRVLLLMVSLGSVLLLLTPLGKTVNGATRWIDLGPAGQIQPAEIVKVAVLIYIAGYIAEKKDEINTLRGYAVPFVVTMAGAGLVYIISDNLSSAIIIAGIGVLMLFSATKEWKWQIIIYTAAAAAVIWGMITIAHAEAAAGHIDTMKFRYKRILIWEDPTNPDFYYEGAYQTLQGLYAIGSGGVFGKGIGKGVQKLGKVPEVHNDMIYSAICEEGGLIGAAFVLILLGAIVMRCLQIALKSRDIYGMLLCTGVMIHIALQTILNVMVVTNTMPNTGVSLPFISYGGTSALFLMVEVGLVLRVARNNSR